jgi:acyl-CoA synthetase (AMP-forming)/AMP-acid ligase II
VAGNNVYPKKLERMIKTNKNVAEINIFKEDSVLQGHVVGAKIRLHKSTEKSQQEFKNWCLENINIAILPKKWLFE